MALLTFHNAVATANTCPTMDIATLTSADAQLLADAFATILDRGLKVSALFNGASRLSETDAAAYVESLGLGDRILDLKKGKTVGNSLVETLAKIMNARLQKVGDSVVVDGETFDVTLTLVEKVKTTPDTYAVLEDCGLRNPNYNKKHPFDSVNGYEQPIDKDLAELLAKYCTDPAKRAVFKSGTFAINASKFNSAIAAGILNPAFRLSTVDNAILTQVKYKEKKGE